MLLEKNEDFREWIISGRRALQARCPKVRGFKLRLPGSFGIPPIFLSCKRAVLKLRGFKLRLPASFDFLNRLGHCVKHIAGYQSVHAQGCRGDVTS